MKRTCLPQTIKLAIFDLDGTLVDAYRAIADSVNHTMERLGLPRQSLRTVIRSVGWGVDTLIRSFVEEAQAEEALRIFRAHHDKRLRRNLKALPGARALLAFLKKRGCRMAIASNRPTKFCHIILEELEIDGYFDHVVCGDAVKRPKPHPDMIRLVLKKTRVRPSEAIYVGDMSVDILSGNRAGVFTIGVPTGSCTVEEILEAGPDLLIRKLSDIKKIL